MANPEGILKLFFILQFLARRWLWLASVTSLSFFFLVTRRAIKSPIHVALKLTQHVFDEGHVQEAHERLLGISLCLVEQSERHGMS